MSEDVLLEGCEHAGLDENEVGRIAKGLSRYARAADRLGLTIFGGSGEGTLRTSDDLVVAFLDGQFDGGDGAIMSDDNGLEWGESAQFEKAKP